MQALCQSVATTVRLYMYMYTVHVIGVSVSEPSLGDVNGPHVRTYVYMYVCMYMCIHCTCTVHVLYMYIW